MIKSNIYFGRISRIPVLLMMGIFGIAVLLFSSCSKEDDIPPPSAYVEPEIDTTGGCVFLNIVPELNGDETIEFECEGPTFSFFGEKDKTIVIEYVENPSIDGVNASEKVVKVSQPAGIEPWAGLFFDLGSKVDFSTFNAIKVKVYSSAVGQMVNLKMEDAADGSISSETSVLTTVANEWEELSFSFSSDDSGKFDRLVLFFDFLSTKETETVHYFDDIILGDGEIIMAPMEPTIAAPHPTLPESDVISIFSDSYTNLAGTDFNPNWGQATITTQVDIEGNNTLKYENLNYQGTMFESGIDVSGMNFLHIDYWTANSSALNGFLISSDAAETAHAFEIRTAEWVSVDIPLSDFSSVVNLMDVIQMKFDGNGTVYLDNIYFHIGGATEPMAPAPAPSTPEGDVISIYSDAYTNVAGTDFNPDWGQATLVSELDINGNKSLVYENLNYQGTMFASAIDVSEMTFLHVDYWTANSTGFNGFLISPGPAETPHAFDVMSGQWISVEIPLSEYSGVVDLTEVIQMKFDGDGTIYLDNIYFHK